LNEHWELLLDYTQHEQLDFGVTFAGSLGFYDFGDTRLTSPGVNYRW
jgi:hypothetical protein